MTDTTENIATPAVSPRPWRVVAYDDSLRDIVRRIVDEMHYCHRDLDGEMSQRLIDLVYEARDAIGEEDTPCAKS